MPCNGPDRCNGHRWRPGESAGFFFTGTDSAFECFAGAVRVVTTRAGWLVQHDSSGDLVAAMSIDVADLNHVGVTDGSGQFLF